MSAPLVVNTTDGTCWTRRSVTRGGLALYAPEGVCKCPEFVMATLAELAEHGIAGSADVLPVPVGPEPQPSELALPWAHEMSDDDLPGFLDDLVSAAMGRWRSEPEVPDREVLADIERVCADWRTPGQGYRSDEPEVFVPRTERSYWVDIADALNAAHSAGMPVGIDLDGTLTDRNAWSVVWDRAAEQWVVAGYEDDEAEPDAVTRSFLPVASLREDVYESPLHRDWRTPHDLPETGGDDHG